MTDSVLSPVVAPTTPVAPKKVLLILKVQLPEWIANGEMDESPLYPIRREGLTPDVTSRALEILDALKVEIDTEVCSDWVELKRTCDDRVSVLAPGSFIVVWDNGTASFLDGVKAVDYDGDSVRVEF